MREKFCYLFYGFYGYTVRFDVTSEKDTGMNENFSFLNDIKDAL